MYETLTFSEALAYVPRESRTDRTYVLAALWRLQADSSSSVSTKDIAALLRQHFRSKSPRNVSDVLAKLSPLVERVPQDDERLRWHITESGLRRLRDLTGLAFGERSQCALNLSSLHPRVYAVVKDLFRDGHHSEAVGRAAKELNRLVRERTGRTRDDGVPMMHQVFSDTENNAARLIVRPLTEDWERDLQCGLRFMMAGCQSGIANVDKHGNLLFGSELEALECLTLVSYLARQVDRALCVGPTALQDTALDKAA
jgi:uncharacterized protein (TIGR02391 family)